LAVILTSKVRLETFSLCQAPESFNGQDGRHAFMAAEYSKAPPATPGAILKRWLKEHKLPHDRAARQADIGPKTLWRIFTGQVVLDEKLANQIIQGCQLDKAAADELLAALDQHPAPARERSRKSMAAHNFGKLLARLREKCGMSTRKLADECDFKQPNVVAFETGRAVPSPRVAAQIAAILKLSPGDAAKFFELLGDALLEHSAVSKSTTVPALCSLTEWVFSQVPPSMKRVRIGIPVSIMPNAEKAVPLVRAALAEARRQFETQARQFNTVAASPLINACIEHNDGKVTLILPVLVTF